MATPTEPPTFTTTEVITSTGVITDAERSPIASPIGWSSIFAGTAVAVGVWFVLHVFGVGVGMTAIDPEDGSSLRGAGIGVGVWSLLAPIIGLFIGGLVAGRVAPTINTLNAVIHGGVVWALSALAALVCVAMVVAAMARGAVATSAAVGGAAGSAMIEGSRHIDDLSALGVSPDDLIAPINERLQAEGRPTVKADEIMAATRVALRDAIRQGDLDRERLVTVYAQQTSLSRADAERVADVISQKWDQVRARGGDVAEQAKHSALKAADVTGKLLLTLSITMLVGLGAAILGSILAVRYERREHVVLPRAMTRP
ncbi:MAG: hypothetical protein AB7P03_11205 [Kofleriaceae bacterium]